MKKLVFLLLSAVVLASSLGGCSKGTFIRSNMVNTYNMTNADGETTPEASSAAVIDDGEIDVDLTVMNNTMVYSEVMHMLYAPEEYIGKRIKMNGLFSKVREDDGRWFFSCMVSDATLCCSRGIEFILKDGGDDPDSYPKHNEWINVAGVFSTYVEGEYTYCRLVDAVLL